MVNHLVVMAVLKEQGMLNNLSGNIMADKYSNILPAYGDYTKESDRICRKADSMWDKGKLKQAFELFQLAANMGDSTGALNTGYFYDLGIHVRKDKDKAILWYKKALRYNDFAAARNIAIVHKERREWKKALWWFHRAAALGDGGALYQIAQLYQKGTGVKKNIKKAMMYYMMAMSSDHITEDTVEKIEKIIKKIRRNN